eukprot:CAMPEP_0119301502 /NCGR_PEP_ID=MMETSP1333-20130426/3273_1 /TAXON_ID=418940 /ORGANISM="Scyphosphaera apsteinii, Strain RCC1455" /LENGTH=828 /DNA_ID=CAMNT_0007303595 /DNA_START=238 /DNA_END=2724 /DNA_ORIENTATION=-
MMQLACGRHGNMPRGFAEKLAATHSAVATMATIENENLGDAGNPADICGPPASGGRKAEADTECHTPAAPAAAQMAAETLPELLQGSSSPGAANAATWQQDPSQHIPSPHTRNGGRQVSRLNWLAAAPVTSSSRARSRRIRRTHAALCAAYCDGEIGGNAKQRRAARRAPKQMAWAALAQQQQQPLRQQMQVSGQQQQQQQQSQQQQPPLQQCMQESEQLQQQQPPVQPPQPQLQQQTQQQQQQPPPPPSSWAALAACEQALVQADNEAAARAEVSRSAAKAAQLHIDKAECRLRTHAATFVQAEIRRWMAQQELRELRAQARAQAETQSTQFAWASSAEAESIRRSAVFCISENAAVQRQTQSKQVRLSQALASTDDTLDVLHSMHVRSFCQSHRGRKHQPRAAEQARIQAMAMGQAGQRRQKHARQVARAEKYTTADSQYGGVDDFLFMQQLKHAQQPQLEHMHVHAQPGHTQLEHLQRTQHEHTQQPQHVHAPLEQHVEHAQHQHEPHYAPTQCEHEGERVRGLECERGLLHESTCERVCDQEAEFVPCAARTLPVQPDRCSLPEAEVHEDESMRAERACAWHHMAEHEGVVHTLRACASPFVHHPHVTVERAHESESARALERERERERVSEHERERVERVRLECERLTAERERERERVSELEHASELEHVRERERERALESVRRLACRARQLEITCELERARERERECEHTTHEATCTHATRKHATRGHTDKTHAMVPKPTPPFEPYQLYAIHAKDRIWAEYPGACVPQIAGLAAVEWRQLSVKQRAPWHSKAAAELIQYEAEMIQYVRCLELQMQDPPKGGN